jgi:transcriptional regulator with XRE-family HTH domain
VDLRTILAQNLNNARKNLQITRAKLAEFAGISVPYLADIERRRTWVSDKTMQSLADALNLETWELLCSEQKKKKEKSLGQSKESRRLMAEAVIGKKEILQKTVENIMEDLILELVKKEK